MKNRIFMLGKSIWLCMFCFLLVGCSFFEGAVEEAPKEREPEINFDYRTIEQPEGISKDVEENLFYLGKVWGFLKYYHPNVAEGEFNWDQELFYIMPEVLSATSSLERDAVLVEWIEGLGEIKGGKTTPPEDGVGEVKMEPNLDWLNSSGFSEELEGVLQTVKNSERNDSHHYVSLAEGIGNPVFQNELEYRHPYPETEYRLLSLYRYWNIIEYYFPYKYLINEEWDDVMKEFIPKLIQAKNEQEYHLNTLELIARVHDTHANIWNPSSFIEGYWGKRYAPAILTFVEGKPVVTGFYKEEEGAGSGLEVGDVITKVDGKTIDEILETQLKYIPASNYETQLRDMAPKLLRTNEKSLFVEIERNGELKSLELAVFTKNNLQVDQYDIFHNGTEPFQLLDSNSVAYMYMGGFFYSSLKEYQSELEQTKGLIIDFRSYPFDFTVFSLGEYLLPASREFVKFTNGSIEHPGLFTMTDPLIVGEENNEHYKGKIVILINEVTQSSAEYHAMAFRTAENATVIGSTTAAADGNISLFTLPGGIETSITGIGVYYPDGTETQRVGIIPDIYMRPTIEGIKEGRDELLEKAIEIINEQ
ncbi:peptidase S41 [Sutcliffiella horikoshii]|uniref:Peptidase S41 n=1 Tax=Sutcliffiella horikoshii TaxID=79883 RepID=A0A5D4T267_9BACI|nr:S41 family peptidase [Sutcliffiella horikoshii]TYS68226.1 peptidase S41 [Sutcliffiella horikoshii]